MFIFVRTQSMLGILPSFPFLAEGFICQFSSCTELVPRVYCITAYKQPPPSLHDPNTALSCNLHNCSSSLYPSNSSECSVDRWEVAIATSNLKSMISCNVSAAPAINLSYKEPPSSIYVYIIADGILLPVCLCSYMYLTVDIHLLYDSLY